MSRKILFPRGYTYFALFLVAFVVLMTSVEINNGKFSTSDFNVYYGAAADFFAGNNPFIHPYGLDTGYFKYPPATLYFFYFTCKLPYFVAQLLHVVLMAVAYFISLLALQRILFFTTKVRKMGMLYASFVMSVIHLVREFHMGNVNLFLLVFFLLGLVAYLKNELKWLVICWSFMVILKPIVVIVFLPLVFFRHWKVIAGMAALGVVFFLLPLINLSIQDTLDLWLSWFVAVSHHGNYITSESSLTYMAHFYLGITSAWLPSLAVFAVIVVFMVRDFRKANYSRSKLVEWSCVLMAFTPNFFVTDTEHFILSLPLLMLVISYLMAWKNAVAWGVFGIVSFPVVLRSQDLLGLYLSDIVALYGMLGVSNLLFIAGYIFMVETNRTPYKPLEIESTLMN